MSSFVCDHVFVLPPDEFPRSCGTFRGVLWLRGRSVIFETLLAPRFMRVYRQDEDEAVGEKGE